MSGVLSYPYEAIEDSSGAIYIADAGNNRILKISNGTLGLVAGGNASGAFSGDNGPPSSASLNDPQAIVFDQQGNLYISDTNNNRIRKITSAGAIVTVAGTGVAAFSGDGGAAGNAALHYPAGLATDTSGNLYFADDLNQRIREISPSGVITTIAGNGFAGFSGDGGPATSAQLNFPEGVAVDQAGNLYIADNHNSRIRKVSVTDHTISTIAGDGTSGYNGDGIPATSASLGGPTRVVLDANGNLLITDSGNNRIRRVDANTHLISTIAGTGTAGYWGDGGPAVKAQLNIPHDVYVQAGGGFLVAEYGNSVVRTIAPDGTIESLSMALNNVTAGPVRMVYLVPSDSTPQQYYANGMERAIQSLQIFYRNQMGNGATFQLHNPVVETYVLPHPASWYQTQGAFWDTVLADAFKLTGGGFNDPHNRWVYYIQANPACGQQGAISGGTSGVALMPLGDLRGVAGRDDQAPCPGQVNAPTDYLGRWIGGLGHELGHAFNLPHPPQCQNPQPGDPPCDPTILMWTGYITYPNAVLPSPYPSMLEAGGFFVPTNLTSDLPSTLSSSLPGGPTLSVSPQTLSFKYMAGSGPAAQTLNATSSGDSFLVWAQNSSGNLLLGSPYPQATPASISVTPQFTEPGTYSDGVDVFTGGASNGSQHIPVTVTVLPNPATSVTVAAVSNSASGAAGAIAPGEIVTIKGTGLGSANGVSFSVDPGTGMVDSTLAGTQIFFGAFAAPITYTSATQINAIVPYEIAGQSQVLMKVAYQGAMSAGTTLQVAGAAPAAFTFNATGTGQAVAANQDGSFNGPSSPAAAGSYVTIYFTGGGQTNPPGVTGSVTGSVLKWLTQSISATVGGQAATVAFDGAAPTFVDGVGQLNLQLAPNTPSGPAQPLVITVGGISSPATATLAIR
jgi:uncharacterized protein (TIGR03437 family)